MYNQVQWMIEGTDCYDDTNGFVSRYSELAL